MTEQTYGTSNPISRDFINKQKQHNTMKKIYNCILLSALAFASAGCMNEELVPDQPTAETGDEVKFGLSLGEPKTKTIYGDEATTTDGKHVFPIYWIDGDKVQVFSPQCLEGRRSAEYKVVLPDGVTNPYYAEDLTPTGEFGVQWGGNTTADFYSLYPSGNYTLSSDGTKAENINISYTQHIAVNGSSVKSDMEDCMMYARTTGVQRGAVVNLHYDPISTVVMLTLKVAANVTGTDPDTFTIQTISLIADTDIAGTFSLNVADGTFGEFTTGKTAKTVTTQIVNSATGGFHSLKNNESVTVPIFIAPAEYKSVKDWKIQVVANGNTYTKTLNIDKALEPGQIHKIILPELSPAESEWDVSKWMTYIPRNVYLSEVSIPGSWNTLNKEFQGSSPTISAQYANGARAFHLDTRWQGGGSALRPTITNVLGVADGGNTVEYSSNGRVMTDSNNPSVEAALDEMINNIKADEYMVLICTFAQGSHNHSYTAEDGTTLDWIGEISRVCSLKEEVYDAKVLTPNTLVGDVLGKVIVIINTEGAVSSIPSNSKCLFVNIPLTLNSSSFGSALNENNIGDINKGTANNTIISDTEIDMYKTHAQVCISGETYTDSRDRNNVDGRGFAPTFGERKTVANNILKWSKENYGTTNYSHDKWIYLGLGGYYVKYSSGIFGIGAGWKAEDNGHTNVANDLNNWINGKVTEMGTTPSGQTAVVPYYPVGIVLMNFVNNHATTVKNILTLNNKYRLQYDKTKPSDYDPNALSLTEYGSTATTGGSAF